MLPTRCILVLLVLCTPLLTLGRGVQRRAGGHCTPMQGCTCQIGSSGGEREVQCGGGEEDEDSFVIATIKHNLLQVRCTFNTSSQQLEMLDGLQTGPVKQVQILFCPLPDKISLSELVFKMIGGDFMNHTKTLVFQSHRELGSEFNNNHLKGFYGLNRLEISNNQLENVPQDLLYGLNNLTWLDMRGNMIKVLPSGLLKPTPLLTVLEFGDNQILDIPDGLFDNLTSLRLLNLWRNKLTKLTPTTFSSLHGLENLDLFSNELQSLPQDVFQNLPKLKDLNLSSNNLSSLPKGIFENLNNLTRLRLLDNKATNLELPDGLFQNLLRLREIIISRSGVTKIPNNFLKGTTGVTNLTLSGNQINKIPIEIFQDAINLTLIDLSGNRLVNLPDELFTGLIHVKVLRVASNLLSEVTEELLQPLGQLEELDLSNNELVKVSFQGVSKLKVVLLNKNKLSFSDASRDHFGTYSPLHECTLLEEINLANNSITEVSADWRLIMLKLKNLDLSYNNITYLSVEDLHFLSDDMTVDLSHNLITAVDMSVAEIIALHQTNTPDTIRSVRAILDHNPLDCSNCINYDLIRYREGRMSPTVRQLVQIDTSESQCSSGTSFSHFSSTNYTCVVPDRICPTNCTCTMQPSRKALMIKCCEAPSKLPNLGRNINRTEIILEDCALKNAPNIYDIKENLKLTGLFLANNNLSEFRVRSIPHHIEVLELHNNNLSTLNEGVLRHLENTTDLQRLTLSGNPWICDCEAKRLLAYVQAHFTIVADLANVTCNDGRSLHSLSASDLCSPIAAVAASMAIAASGLILGAAAALYYRYQQEIKVWLYARNLCLWFVTEDELDKDKKYDAFISYSHKNEAFVAEHLVPGLEPPFKLCIHVRDWVAGDWIPDQITRSVEHSRRTLVVLSPSFIDSVWGRLEFRAAHQQALSENRVRVIVILLEDVGPIDKLDPELRAYLTMNTYLQWGDPWFWDKLRYALPHRPEMNGGGGWGWGRRRVRDAPSVLARRIEDKLELIRSPPTVIASPPSPSSNTPPAAVQDIIMSNGFAKTNSVNA